MLQRISVAMQASGLLLLVFLLVQMISLTKRLDVRERAEADMMEARVIVLEKAVAKVQATNDIQASLQEIKQEIRNVRAMRDHTERSEQGSVDR